VGRLTFGVGSGLFKDCHRDGGPGRGKAPVATQYPVKVQNKNRREGEKPSTLSARNVPEKRKSQKKKRRGASTTYRFHGSPGPRGGGGRDLGSKKGEKRRLRHVTPRRVSEGKRSKKLGMNQNT